MQQTEFYYLNKIETDDPFSPNPLNQNAESVETADYLTGVAVRAEAQARDALDQRTTSLEQRVTVLEAKKMVTGTYRGTGLNGLGSQIIELGFSPLALIVWGYNYTSIALKDSSNGQLKITETGFVAHNSSGVHLNNSGSTYNYIAFA